MEAYGGDLAHVHDVAGTRPEALADLDAAALQPRILTGYGRQVRLRRGHLGLVVLKRR
jgi:hypothetical protein